MNDDDFEQKLREASRALSHSDPTPAWKEEILATARREAGAIFAPPRPLLFAWAAAWAAIVVLSLSTPRNAGPAATSGLTGSRAESNPVISSGAPTLFAFEQEYKLDAEAQ